MAVYIKTPEGLKRISNEDIEAKDIEKALGYTPSDFSGNYQDLNNAPDIFDDASGVLVIADQQGNIILKIDNEGLHTTDVEIDGMSVKHKLENMDSLTDDSDTLYVTDGSGNIIAKIDKDGVSTTQVNAKQVILDGESIEEKLANQLTSIDENADDKAFHLIDDSGNIIFTVDSTGVQATEFYNPKNDYKVLETLEKAVEDINNLKNIVSEGGSNLTPDNFTIVEKEGKISLNSDYSNYLEKQLQPNILKFDILDSSGQSITKKAVEIGTTLNMSKFVHYESYISRIDGHLAIYKNEETAAVATPITPSETENEGKFSISHTFGADVETVKYTLKGTSVSGATLSKTVSISSHIPAFIGASYKESFTLETDVRNLTKKEKIQGTHTVTVEGNYYIYFCTVNEIKNIKSEEGYGVAYKSIGEKGVTINGKYKMYNIYRTDTPISAGTYTLIIT